VGDQITSKPEYNNEYTVFGATRGSVTWSRDAKNETVHLGRYAQDPIAYSRCNATFKRDYTNRTVRLVATRTIKEGEEIFVSYGTKYWIIDQNYQKLTRAHKRYIYNHVHGYDKKWLIGQLSK